MAPVAHAGRVDARTVLLADDDEDFRVALAEALDEEGYAVVAVANGAAALAALEHAAKGRAPAQGSDGAWRFWRGTNGPNPTAS